MTQQIDGLRSISNSIDLGPTGSLQLTFAKLQLSLAETNKSKAMERIDAIYASQDEQKAVSRMLNDARAAKAAVSDGKKVNDKNYSAMTDEMKTYMDAKGLAYDKTGNDNLHTEKEWDVAIESLKAHLDTLGTGTQQEMVFVQDYMGQYNSFMQGANSVIQQHNETTRSLANVR